MNLSKIRQLYKSPTIITTIVMVIIIGIVLLISKGCKHDPIIKPKVETKTFSLPTVTTNLIVSEITGSTAMSGGNVTNDGGTTVTARGVCWSTSIKPTICDNKTTDGIGTGNFSSNIGGLIPNTTYFVCAYATSCVGTSYGKIVGFCANKLPQVTSNLNFIKITTKSLISGGTVTSDGGETVTSKGVCWSTKALPTINDEKTNDGMLIGSFTSLLTGLKANTTYHVRAYATTISGTAYGEDGIVKTWDLSRKVNDIDGNVYHSVEIGSQVWLVENLQTTRYRNGDLIPTTSPATLDVSAEITPKYQWAYNGDESYVATYGRLYTWYVVGDPRNVAPEGWHVATKADWDTLDAYLKSIGYREHGNKYFEDNAKNSITKALASKTNWIPNLYWPNTVGYDLSLNNSSGFTALPGGVRICSGSFDLIRSDGHWWGMADNPSTDVVEHRITSQSNNLYHFSASSSLNNGYSIRCVKD